MSDPVATVSAATRTTATVIPAPVSRTDGDGVFTLGSATSIESKADAASTAEYLASVFRTATGLPLPITSSGDIVLEIGPGHPKDGYDLVVTTKGIHLSASDAAGLFAGVQTLRQLVTPLPHPQTGGTGNATSTGTTTGTANTTGTGSTSGTANTTGIWSVPATTISDYPRFAYRGAMLDVARHFFSVDDVKRYIDAISLLKLNVLHLHLTDDQGWRIEIMGWPRLTEHGGSTQVGGGGGGLYTQDDYREIVAHAASRYITVVPEIDLPGHTNAALASYPELTCDGVAPALYEGIDVGFSSLCIGKERTYEFVADVLEQVAALTPGPWIHIGGDEALATPDDDYLRFIERAAGIAAATGKTVIGWHEMGRSRQLPAGTVGEYWNFTTPEGDAADRARTFVGGGNDGDLRDAVGGGGGGGGGGIVGSDVSGGGTLIMAPADVAYLDMKYDESSPLGLVWAHGPTSVQKSYEWDPADIIPGISDDDILGVEAPLWTETITTLAELESMAFPRIASIAEIGWSQKRERDFAEFAPRLATFGTQLDALGIHYERAPGIPWH